MRVDTGSKTRRDRGRPEGPGPAVCTASEPKSKLSAPLLEHAGEGVKLLGHAAGLPDDIGEGDHLDLAVAADRDHPTLSVGDQLCRPNAPARGPDAVGRRRRDASPDGSEHRDPGLAPPLMA